MTTSSLPRRYARPGSEVSVLIADPLPQILDTVQSGLVFHIVDEGLGRSQESLSDSDLTRIGQVRIVIAAGFRFVAAATHSPKL